MKKCLAVMLLAFMGFSLCQFPAAAGVEVLRWYIQGASYEYILNENNEALILMFNADSEAAEKGGRFEFASELDGRVVTGFASPLDDSNIPNSLKGFNSILLPKTYVHFPRNPFLYEYSLPAFEVEEGNPVLEAVDGVLYDMVQKKLIAYPMGRNAAVYQVPPGTLIIGKDAFYQDRYNYSDFQVVLPEGLEQIEAGAINVYSQEELELPDSLKVIRDSAFTNCAITKLTIPDGVEKIGGNPFPRNMELKIKAKHPVFRYEKGVLYNKVEKELLWFSSKANAKTYVIPKDIRRIGSGALSGLDFSSNKKFKLLDSLEEIGPFAFTRATLPPLSLPSGLKEIGMHAFSYAKGLRELTVPGGVKEIGYWSFGLNNDLERIVFEEGIEKIGNFSFYVCDSLAEVVLPESLLEIGSCAFECYGAPMKELKVPKSVNWIGEDAFLLETLLLVYENSLAHQYAAEQGLNFMLIAE